ncbi:hypothetical protein N7517_002812 [Penicillium concentricum]|uniref:Uncharacterized protein n=1 Tax=Penicillium concentricum TaxID=293559 RepID=A0A9W9SUE1_9EURO|nr:uncharacterized protein N7517_002812 [Penicillium concentricum]KAJ5384901.1 hypothetical protein N7517_002812 [Penicillium concentricum]
METSQGKEPLMRSSEASKTDHRDVEAHQETEPVSESLTTKYLRSWNEPMSLISTCSLRWPFA